MQVVFRDDSDHGIVGPGRRSQRREAPGVFLEVPGWIESSALRGSTLALVVQVHTTRMNWLRKMMGSSGSRPAQPTPGEDPPLKTISYRGGVVTFRIPAHWLEEHDPDGGGTFYDDAPDSGTFRLQIITVEAPSPLTAESAPDVLSSLRQAATAPVQRLPSGCALNRYTQSAADRGHRLLITYWSVAHVVPPSHARIANFSYTLLERQRNDARCQRELELLDREVRASVFSPELGVASA